MFGKKLCVGGGLQIFFIFVDMGPYGSENFKTLLLQIAAETFQFFLNSLPIGPHKTMFGIYEMLKIKILTILFFHFVNMAPSGNENFKALLLIQIAGKSFQTSLLNIFSSGRVGFLRGRKVFLPYHW